MKYSNLLLDYWHIFYLWRNWSQALLKMFGQQFKGYRMALRVLKEPDWGSWRLKTWQSKIYRTHLTRQEVKSLQIRRRRNCGGISILESFLLFSFQERDLGQLDHTSKNTIEQVVHPEAFFHSYYLLHTSQSHFDILSAFQGSLP